MERTSVEIAPNERAVLEPLASLRPLGRGHERRDDRRDDGQDNRGDRRDDRQDRRPGPGLLRR